MSGRPRSMTLADRVWEKVARGDGCWEWQGARNKDGYGRIRVGHAVFRAHRVVWILLNGSVEAGLEVLHRCDNPPCCRPDHLFIGTQPDNVDDMVQKGRFRASRGNTRLSLDDVLTARARRAAGETYKTIAASLGVTDVAVRYAVNGTTWSQAARPNE